MGLDPQLKAQLRQVVAYSSTTATVNVYGELGAATVATTYCRLEHRVREYELEGGTIAKTTHMMILDGSGFTPTLATQFWLPGHSPASATFARRPFRIHPCVGELGTLDHFEVEL